MTTSPAFRLRTTAKQDAMQDIMFKAKQVSLWLDIYKTAELNYLGNKNKETLRLFNLALANLNFAESELCQARLKLD